MFSDKIRNFLTVYYMKFLFQNFHKHMEIKFYIHFPCNCIIVTKNRNQFVAQYPFLFVFRSTTCFGHIYWPTLGSHMQRCLNLELSHVVTTVVVFTIFKIRWYLKQNWNIIKIQLRTA